MAKSCWNNEGELCNYIKKQVRIGEEHWNDKNVLLSLLINAPDEKTRSAICKTNKLARELCKGPEVYMNVIERDFFPFTMPPRSKLAGFSPYDRELLMNELRTKHYKLLAANKIKAVGKDGSWKKYYKYLILSDLANQLARLNNAAEIQNEVKGDKIIKNMMNILDSDMSLQKREFIDLFQEWSNAKLDRYVAQLTHIIETFDGGHPDPALQSDGDALSKMIKKLDEGRRYVGLLNAWSNTRLTDADYEIVSKLDDLGKKLLQLDRKSAEWPIIEQMNALAYHGVHYGILVKIINTYKRIRRSQTGTLLVDTY
jgi:hypothetical protein